MKHTYDSSSTESILNYSKQIENHSLREVIQETPEKYNSKNKGALGHAIERDFFGYEINPRKEADFAQVNLELKVVPIKKIRKNKKSDQIIKQLGMSAKERIILSKINYNNIIKETWTTTELHHKIDQLLLMFYMYDKDLSIYDLKFLLSSIWEPLAEDLTYLQKDWELIQSKVLTGNAHDLSEGDTLLLGACTKGVNKKSLIKQPRSSIMAMQRAYSLKRAYVDHIFNRIYSDSLLKKTIIVPLDIYEKILTKFSKIQYGNLEELFKRYNINVNRDAKQFLYLATSALFEKLMGMTADNFNENNISQIEIKTVLLKSNNVPKESMSFEQIKFDEIVDNEWMNSEFRSKFENKKLLWVIYKTTKPYKRQRDLNLSDINFIDIFYWNMPNADLDSDVKNLWIDTVEKIKNNDFNNFKKISETRVSHVRPKAKNSKDTVKLFSGNIAPKKSFWLNSAYVAEQIKIELTKKDNRFY